MAEETPAEVTTVCVECGDLIEVKDVRALILSLHLHNECVLSPLLSPHE